MFCGALLCSHISRILLRKCSINIDVLAVHNNAWATVFPARPASGLVVTQCQACHSSHDHLPVSFACSRSLYGTHARGELYKRCPLRLFKGLIHDQPAHTLGAADKDGQTDTYAAITAGRVTCKTSRRQSSA